MNFNSCRTFKNDRRHARKYRKTPTAVKAMTVIQDVKQLTEADCWFIIEEVKNRPLLWDVSNESHNNIECFLYIKVFFCFLEMPRKNQKRHLKEASESRIKAKIQRKTEKELAQERESSDRKRLEVERDHKKLLYDKEEFEKAREELEHKKRQLEKKAEEIKQKEKKLERYEKELKNQNDKLEVERSRIEKQRRSFQEIKNKVDLLYSRNLM